MPLASLASNVVGSSHGLVSSPTTVMFGLAFSKAAMSSTKNLRWAAWVLGGSQPTVIFTGPFELDEVLLLPPPELQAATDTAPATARAATAANRVV